MLALAQDPAAWRYGYELCQCLGLKAGSMYPILMRLAHRWLLKAGGRATLRRAARRGTCTG